ncbi:MAG: hypothetical protein H7Z41_12820 [Cytophagales bacterium]|nr:hypothetical protein [Armatimonadota bacterium]
MFHDLIVLIIGFATLAESAAIAQTPKVEKRPSSKFQNIIMGGSGIVVAPAAMSEEQKKLMNEGNLSIDVRDLPAAEETFTKLLADPSLYVLFKPLVLTKLAQIYTETKQWNKCVETYNHLLKPNQGWITSRSNDAGTRLNFARALYAVGEFEEARVNYNIGASVLHPENYQLPLLPHVTPQLANSVRLPILIHLGLAVEKMNSNFEQAVAEARAAVNLGKDYGLSHLYLGKILYSRGTLVERKEVKAEFELAAKLGEKDVKNMAEEQLKRYK